MLLEDYLIGKVELSRKENGEIDKYYRDNLLLIEANDENYNYIETIEVIDENNMVSKHEYLSIEEIVKKHMSLLTELTIINFY